VVVNDLEAEPAQEVVAAIKAAGGKAVAVVGSVTDPAFPEQFISAGLDAFGGIDIIVNNAGYVWDAMVHKMSDEQFDAMLDVHLKAPFRILRAAADRSAAGGETGGRGRPRSVPQGRQHLLGVRHQAAISARPTILRPRRG
jgi:3-oxoacyl-[acyl-carrier protein] reductase